MEAYRAKTVEDLAGLAVRMTEAEIAASIVHGGIRPKATYYDEKGEIGRPKTHYIVKFNNPKIDEINNARVEHASLTLSRLANVNAAHSVVVRVLKNGSPVSDMLFVERFDRFTNEKDQDCRQHRLSLLALMDPNKIKSQDQGDYTDIFSAIRKVSSSPDEDCKEMFRRLLFNISVNNTDDHLKNHEMVCDAESGEWRLSPAFDIVPNKNPYPHVTSICGLSNGTLKDDFVLKIANKLDIEVHDAIKIRDEVALAVSKWRVVFEAAGCDNKDIDFTSKSISQNGKRAESTYNFGRNLPDPLETAKSKTSIDDINAIRLANYSNYEVNAPPLPPFNITASKRGPS